MTGGPAGARGPDVLRCPWVDPADEEYVLYHDAEWGVPVHDDRLWFEFLTLETFQAGLSWRTILRKRTGFREAFAGFRPEEVARFDVRDEERLMADAGIVRNRLKIRAAIRNACRFLDVAEEFGTFDGYIWRFTGGEPVVHIIRSLSDYRATSPESDDMSRDLRRRGFSFVGSTICYAHMQATGMVNDHHVDCFRRSQIIAGCGAGRQAR